MKDSLSSLPDETPGERGVIHLFPDGQFRARDGRPGADLAWRLDQAGADALVRDWKARLTPLAVDYEHQTELARENGRPAPAAGWVRNLFWVPGRGLFAEVEWTRRAAEYIRGREYQFISPAFRFDQGSGAVLALTGAALTNNPALDGLAPVTVPGALQNGTPRSPEGAPPAAPAHGAAPAAPDPEKTRADQLSRQLREAEKEKVLAELYARIDAALADGRLHPSAKEWARNAALTAPDVLRGFLDASAPVAALCGLQSAFPGVSRSRRADAPALSAEELRVCALLGMDINEFAAHRAPR